MTNIVTFCSSDYIRLQLVFRPIKEIKRGLGEMGTFVNQWVNDKHITVC